MKKKENNEYEEVIIKCIGCGKKIKVIKIKGYDVNTFLCQKCGKSEGRTET